MEFVTYPSGCLLMRFPLHFLPADAALNSPLVIQTSEFSNRFSATLYSIDKGLSLGPRHRNRRFIMSQFLLSMSTLFQNHLIWLIVQRLQVGTFFFFGLYVVACFGFVFNLEFTAII